jgi:hypothetical protein
MDTLPNVKKFVKKIHAHAAKMTSQLAS